MRFAIVSSFLLHFGGFMLAYVAWPEFRENPVVQTIVPIAILSEAELAEETSVPEMVKEDEQPPEPEETPPAEALLPEPEAEPNLLDDPPPADVKPPEPEKTEPEDKPEEKLEPPEDEEKPEPVKPEPKEPELDLGDLESALRNLDPDKSSAPQDVPLDPNVGDRNQRRVGLGDRLTASEEDKMKSRIYTCWNAQTFIGAPNVEDLLVRVEFELNPDGSVAGNPRVSNGLQIQTSGNPFWRVAEREAVNAIIECAPYDFLSRERYEIWKEMKLNFDPSEMAGF